MIDKNLTDLAPRLQELCQRWLDLCKSAGLSVIITETWRSPAREDYLHSEGITAATGLTCKHCTMIGDMPASQAFDFLIFRDGKVVADGTDPLYSKAGAIGKSLGLSWGGDWHHPDYDHLELDESS